MFMLKIFGLFCLPMGDPAEASDCFLLIFGSVTSSEVDFYFLVAFFLILILSGMTDVSSFSFTGDNGIIGPTLIGDV